MGPKRTSSRGRKSSEDANKYIKSLKPKSIIDSTDNERELEDEDEDLDSGADDTGKNSVMPTSLGVKIKKFVSDWGNNALVAGFILLICSVFGYLLYAVFGLNREVGESVVNVNNINNQMNSLEQEVDEVDERVDELKSNFENFKTSAEKDIEALKSEPSDQ